MKNMFLESRGLQSVSIRELFMLKTTWRITQKSQDEIFYKKLLETPQAKENDVLLANNLENECTQEKEWVEKFRKSSGEYIAELIV